MHRAASGSVLSAAYLRRVDARIAIRMGTATLSAKAQRLRHDRLRPIAGWGAATGFTSMIVLAVADKKVLAVLAVLVAAVAAVYWAVSFSLERAGHAERCRKLGHKIEDFLMLRVHKKPLRGSGEKGTDAWQQAQQMAYDQETMRLYRKDFDAPVAQLRAELSTRDDVTPEQLADLAPAVTPGDVDRVGETLTRICYTLGPHPR